jgi:hypothetical protein
MQYDLNTSNAKAAAVSTRIQEKGAYIGKITRAEEVTSRSGTKGIEFSFQADSGGRADYLTLWTVGADGQELYGRKVLDALMTVAKVRSIKSEPTPTKRGDGTTETVPQFRSLLTRVGLFLIVEQYEKNDGSVGEKMVIALPFCPDTKRTAAEVLDRVPTAESFDTILAALRDRPLKNGARRSAAPATSRSPQTASGTGFDDMDDDVPF